MPRGLIIPPANALAFLAVISFLGEFVYALGEQLVPVARGAIVTYPLISIVSVPDAGIDAFVLAIPTAVMVPVATALAFWVWEHAELVGHEVEALHGRLINSDLVRRIYLKVEELIELMQEIDEDERLVVLV